MNKKLLISVLLFFFVFSLGIFTDEKPKKIKKCEACIPMTGQIVSYAAGDDGDLQMGVAWPEPRFTDNGDGTVTDNLTGLMWTKSAQQIPGPMNWYDAINACNNLEFAEYEDWRLPNIRELHSLIDYGESYPALPSGHPFTDEVSDKYWSSTTEIYPGGYIDWAMAVYLGNGGVWEADKNTGGFKVWPVRGGSYK